MSWVAVVLLLVGVYLAIKVAGFALKLFLWAVVIGIAYWLLAPMLGLPVPF
ncbi:hypothetical protein [Pseudoxanthomonas gei]|uniref:hypothetical protein n=1 Tax=Pseudoxanthomonas gei TaxID=1383030 RepID=UPI0013908526|nr:hypothetical protein [Pseudoxanthomonas gei]